MLDFAVLAFLPDYDFARLQIGIDDGLRAEWHRFRACLLAVRHAADAQDRFAVVFFDADAILLVQRDAFGVKNGGRRQFAIWCFGALPVCDDGDRPVLVDDQSAGEFVVHVVDINGDFCRVCFVLFEKANQLFGAGCHCPERHFLPVDGDGGLVGASYRHHVMVAQHVGGAGGFHKIMCFDLHAALLQ